MAALARSSLCRGLESSNMLARVAARARSSWTPAPCWQIRRQGHRLRPVAGHSHDLLCRHPGLRAALLIIFGMIAAAGTALTVIGVNMIACIYITFPFDESVTTRQRSGGASRPGWRRSSCCPLPWRLPGCRRRCPWRRHLVQRNRPHPHRRARRPHLRRHPLFVGDITLCRSPADGNANPKCSWPPAWNAERHERLHPKS